MDKYQELGFHRPQILMNDYGIRIYIGTPGEEDWCVQIPVALLNKKMKITGRRAFDKDFTWYLISESEALRIAEDYTTIAKMKF